MKKPNFNKYLNLEKGKISGYNPKLKIKVPKNVDKEFIFRVRMNFCPSYIQIKDPMDHQIVVDFLKAFPKVEFSKGFGFGMPKELED